MSDDALYKNYYADVRAEHPEIPAWEDLTEEQKSKIRAASVAYIRDMNALGDEIAKGGKP